jgi:hypothetical protein
MSFYKKYIKYKNKYLELKNKIFQTGGNSSEFINKINNYYQNILNFEGEHVFFESHKWWSKTSKSWKNNSSNKIKFIKNNIDEIKTLDDCYSKINKIASKKYLLSLYQLINNKKNTDFEIIRKKLDILFNYNLPSTIKLNHHLKYIKNSNNTINILILGAGPVGLFNALYINHYYNELINDFSKEFNILLIDNRIYHEGTKKPYTRSTMFGFDILNLQPFINQIFCWNLVDAGGTRKFDYIYILENLLYITAFGKNIPMYFTDKYKTFENIKELCDNNNFHYIFDCTGGRLKTNLNYNLKWNTFNFTKKNLSVKLDNDNYYKLYINNQKDYQPMFLLYIFDKNMKQIPKGTQNYMVKIETENDLSIIKKFTNKYFHIEEYIKLSYNFEDSSIRNLLHEILNKENIKNVKFIKISMFDASSKHLTFCAKIINKNLTYIALGDTLGHSEYGIWFGMKHNILLSRHIIHLIDSYSY